MNAKNTSTSGGAAASMFLAAAAGGMAWGIRGQYGHETGAMMAGVLVGFVLVLLHGRHLSGLQAARAVALFALGISIGGCMTYGQTVGLTHDGPLVGNDEAYRWGMLGLGIKGGIWIGFGAAFFGIALSGKRYTTAELCWLLLFMIVALGFGVYALNEPYEPARRLLPKIYFSDHWYWEADVDQPRRERWGGLLCALGVLLIYLAVVKRDLLACSLGLWGCIAGGLGFPAGQAVQAYHAWHGPWLHSLRTHVITDTFNWWNMMETTFGFVFGAVIGLAVWLNRGMIRRGNHDAGEPMPVWLELGLLAIHVRLLIAWNFQSFGWLDAIADWALPMVVIPVIVVMAGRTAAFWMALPITLLPIAGKTVRHLVYGEASVSVSAGYDLYLVLPMLCALVAAAWLAKDARRTPNLGWCGTVGLTVATWAYFYLNNAFFHSPWIWKQPWTGRTANGFLFSVFAVCLTIAAVWYAPTDTATRTIDGEQA